MLQNTCAKIILVVSEALGENVFTLIQARCHLYIPPFFAVPCVVKRSDCYFFKGYPFISFLLTLGCVGIKITVTQMYQI